MKRAVAGSLLVAGVLLAGGCATVGGPSETPRDGADLAELKRRVVELQRQARMSEVEITRLRQRVAELEARLESRPTGTTVDDDALLLEEIDLEPEERAGDPTPTREAPPPPSTTGSSEGPAARPVTPEAQQIYDEGYTLYHRGRYLDAEATFQRFLRLYGNSDLGDNAQYWIGEARYARGDLRGALSAFRETIERYPRGNKVPDALVKAGQTLEALGDVEGARETYGEVLRRFPDSPTAAVAREHLNRLP